MSKKIICRDVNDNESEVDADKFTFRPSVYGILIEDDKVFLSTQYDGYDFPGGGVDVDETIEDALKREFMEETGLAVEVLQPVFCGTSFFNPNYSEKYKGQYWNCQLMYFIVKRVGGEISTDNFSEQEKEYAGMPEWVDIKDIESAKFYNAVDSPKIINGSREMLKK